MSIANEKKDIHTELPLQAIPQEEPTNPVLPVRVPVEQQTPTGGPLQVIPQEEPRNPLLLVPEQKPRTDTSLPSPAEPNTVVHSKEVKPSPSSVPGTKQTTMITTTKHSIKKQLETSHAKNIQGTDSSNKPTTSTNTANSLPTSEIPSTQQSLADQQASAQIPSPTKMALLSTIDTPNHTLSNSKPSPTSVPKERTTLQVELQKMIAKHREQETVRTGSATAHEEQMKLIKQLLSEIAGSPNNVPVMQVQTTTPIPVQQILQLIQAQEVNAALPVQVPRSTVQSTLFNDIIAMMQSNEAHTGNPTQSVRVNQLPHNQQQINFNGHPMMHQHTVIDPLEQQRIAMMSQMGNPMAGMYGGMMGYMNPEMMQEMMYGDTTDPPDPVQPPEQSNKKKEEQEGMTRPVPTTPVPTTTTVTVAQPLRHRTPLKLQPSHHALRDPDIRAYPPTRGPTTKSSWQEMDAAHFNTRHRYLPSNSEALSEVKQRQRPMQPPLSDAQIRKQHEHKYQILGTYETIKGPAMLESPSRPKEGFTPTTDPNMLLKIKASIERALKSAGIAKDVEIVLTDNNEEQTTSPTPLTGNTLLEKVKTSIENALQSAGISKNVKLVLKPKNKENRQMPVVTKAPVITTKSVIKPTKDSSWITQEGSQVTDMQTKPTTVNEALHGGMSFLSYSERPAKIPVDSSNHVYVQHNVRKRKHKETLNRHPLDSLMIGHITTVSPNYETPKSKDLPQNVELLGGFTPDIYLNEQGNRLTGGIDNIHKDTSSQAMIEGGWKVLSTDLHSSGTNNVINQVDKAETIQVKPDNFVPPPPRNKNRIFHRVPPHSRIPPKEPAKTTDVPQESTKPKLQSDRSDIVNKLIQALAASKHKGLLDSLSDVLLGKQSNHVGDGNTKQAHEASRRTWQGQRTTGIGSGITPSVKSQVHYTESKDATRHVPPPVLSLSQAPNKIHSTHNHIISAPLEPIKSNDKVFGSMNDMPHNRHESKVLSNVVRTPSEITMDSASTSPIQVPAQPDIASTQTKNTLATDQVIRQNIATKHITLNHYVVPSNSPRMIHTTNANTFSGANLFRRQTQDLPPHIDTQLHQTRIIQPKDALYQQEGPSVLEQTQAIKQGIPTLI
ncbi:uncharacterized protein LOC110447527 isoform X3 [Mizuhopecten yessoensis]|nr:uncharacterized protein LOC110447527 isoform X3 [Mizuhopecten yessoensis]